LVKPGPEVYRMAAERLGVACSEMVFTDDAEDNVEGAAACGCTGILYTDYPTFVADLEALIVKQ
jgi:putative hydrolase of the HAD superfamily